MAFPKTVPETTLQISRVYQATREKLFRAWTNPETLKKWWGPEGCTPSRVELDLRVGGLYRIGTCKTEAGEEIFVNGEFREITPPERLVFTWNWEPPGMEIEQTLVTVEFRNHSKGTELTLTHERFPDEKTRDMHGFGWNSGFDCLEKFLA